MQWLNLIDLYNNFQIEVRRWIHALIWHNLPEDKRDVVPTGMNVMYITLLLKHQESSDAIQLYPS